MKTDTIEITKKLITIPSYVAEKVNEVEMGKYLESFLKRIFPKMIIYRQYLSDGSGRFNVIMKGKKQQTLFINGHIDTVQPKTDWKTNPLIPVIENGRIYGLGSADMKGSLAAFLSALVNQKNNIDPEKLLLLFYIDEEYDFKGMRQFVEKLSPIQPKLVVSLDGELEVASGCRGLIELNIVFRGKSGHSAQPKNGTNVITATGALINEFSQQMEKYKDKYLGSTTANLAYIQASTIVKNKDKLVWQREGNCIPDFADITLEIRPAIKKVDKEFVIRLLTAFAKKYQLKIESIITRHNISPLPVAYENGEFKILEKIYKKSDIPFSKADRKYSGYIDIEMLQKKISSPMVIIGAGGENYHGANENVSIKNLLSVQKIYEQLLLTYCRKENV